MAYIIMASPVTTGDAVSFQEQHSREWRSAELYCETKRAAWHEVFMAYGVDDNIAEAIVFPEIVRYNACLDYMETTLVYGGYVTSGSSSFDFSIGRMQMKPSFAEKLEKRWMQTEYASRYETSFDTDDTIFARKARIARLNDDFWQSVYLAIFLKMLYTDYDMTRFTAEQQVAIAATAYNAGCQWGEGGDVDGLEERSGEYTFHTDFLPSDDTSYYSYSEIAQTHWRSRVLLLD